MISYTFENGKKDFELQNKLITVEKTFNKSANKKDLPMNIMVLI
jgi:hypothetical protein